MRKISITDHRLFEVRLIVAVPDYGKGSFDALDAIVPFIDAEVTVLDMSSKALVVALDEPTNQLNTFVAATTSTTFPVAKETTKPTKRGKNKKARNANQIWTDQDRAEVLRLADKGISRKQIAKQAGRTLSSVENQIWLMRKEK